MASEYSVIHNEEGEIKEEAIELKPFIEYGLISNECLENHENKQFYDPDSNEFEITRRNGIEDPKETNLLENTDSNDLAGELAKPKVNDFNNGDNAELDMDTLKTEDDIDIVYEDVKHEIREEKPDILIGTEIGPNFSHEFSKDSETWPQQNIEEEGTARSSSFCGVIKSYCVYFKITYDLEESYSVQFETSTNRRVTKPQLVGDYASLAKIKQEVFEAEKTYKERKQEREEILFELEKNKLELDIKIRLLQLKKLQEQHVFVI
ncbi:hypothetical protein JTB14_037632 [Gonioctena quinquepunctata]|nr:hypothetical protein JTB14_037632 [Gonioctena quinquepunctata]